MLEQIDDYSKASFYQELENGDIYVAIPRCGINTVRDFYDKNGVPDVKLGYTGMASVDDALAKQAQGSRIIATVRDPVERLRSAFSSRWQWYDAMTFGQFISQVISLGDDEINLLMKSQTWYLTTESGQVIVPDVYLHTDTLSTELEAYRIAYQGQFRRRNAAIRPKPPVTPQFRGIINQRYSDDVDLWAAANL